MLQESPRSYPQVSPLIRPVIKAAPPHASPLLAAQPSRLLTDDEISKLESQSNYQNLLQGSGSVLGVMNDSELVMGVGQRKLTHKTAEQRRRDCLKSGYDELRDMLPNCDKAASKVEVLKKGALFLDTLWLWLTLWVCSHGAFARS